MSGAGETDLLVGANDVCLIGDTDLPVILDKGGLCDDLDCLIDKNLED